MTRKGNNRWAERVWIYTLAVMHGEASLRKTWFLKDFPLFGSDQTFNHNPETFIFTKMWHFILIKLSTVLPFLVTFQKVSFVSRELLLANVTLLYSMLAEREKKCPWVLNMESVQKLSRAERFFSLLRLHLSLRVVS